MTDPDVVYCWSTDEEGYSGKLDSREEAAIEGIIETNTMGEELKVGDTIYTAVAQPADLKRYVEHAFNMENVFENITEAAYEEGGEWVDDWPEMPKKAEPDLTTPIVELIVNWLKVYRKPTWYMACDVEATKITAEMLEQAK